MGGFEEGEERLRGGGEGGEGREECTYLTFGVPYSV